MDSSLESAISPQHVLFSIYVLINSIGYFRLTTPCVRSIPDTATYVQIYVCEKGDTINDNYYKIKSHNLQNEAKIILIMP